MTAAGAQAGTDLVIARAESVTRTFGSGRTEVRALRGVTLSVSRGELVALRGRSGSGKTTLLSIIGGLDQPTSGRVEVAGQDVTAMDADGRARLLRDTVAFIFQAFGLIPILSAAENVGLPMRLARTGPAKREQRAAACSTRSASAAGRRCVPTSFPAASSSGSRSPGRWPTNRSCCWRTSRPASWTRTPRSRSCGCCAASCTPRGSPRS
jgi:predicted ABC-type transport system involved in lysophospholipase L1 biosynthesis ATPase subunit